MSPPEQNLVDVVCPACGEQYHLRREALGRRIECVNKLCRQRFVAELRDAASPPWVEALPVEPPPAESLPTEPPMAEALPPLNEALPVDAQATPHASTVIAPVAKHRPARKPRRQPTWAWAMEVMGAAAIVVLGAYVVWSQWRRHSADAETDWQSLQADYQEHKWTHARQGFSRYAKRYPESSHAADVPFFVSMCEAGDKVYSPTGDLTRGLESLEKVFRTHRDSAAYRNYAADLFQALGRLVERFTQRAEHAMALDDLKQAHQAAADVRHAEAAQTLLKTVAQSMKDVWVPERVAKLDRQIDQTGAEVRTGLARKEIVSLLAGIGRLAVGDEVAGVYEQADRLLSEHAELKDDPQIARARAAAYRSDAGRVRFHADAAESLPTPAADAMLRVVERGSTTDTRGATLAVVWREGTDRPLGPPGSLADADSDAVVLSLVDGILYAFDSGGGVRWARRLGLDANRLPLRLPATEAAPETLVAMSADIGAVIALDAKSGETRWSYQPTSPATGHLTLISATGSTAGEPAGRRGAYTTTDRAGGTPVSTGGAARQRVLLPTVDGRIDVIEPVLGKRLGYFETGWPLSVGGAHDRATGLIYFPADSERIFALDAAAIDGRGEACRSVLVTRHASGSLASAPLVIGPYLVLIESANLDRTRLRAFALGESGFAEPDDKALAEQTVAGWSWYPPLATPERLLLATDQSELGLFGFNLDNRAEAIYRLIDEGGQQPSTRIARGTDSRALALRAEGRLLWVMAGGRLEKLGIDLVGQRITKLWEDAPAAVAGGPLHPAQAETRGGRTILYLTTAEGAARRELTAVAADTGLREWRRMLGISPIGDPAASGGAAIVLDRGGGIAAIRPPPAGTAPVVSVVEPDSPGQTDFGEPQRFMSDRGTEHALQMSADGASVRLRVLSAASPWQIRRLPSPLAGRPALVGDLLIAPCADGLLHRIAGEGFTAENEQPFHWSDGDRQSQTAELMPLADKSVVVSDGWRVRRLEYEVDQTIGQWREVSSPYVSADRLVGRPVTAGDRLFVASAAGALVALAADAPGSALRTWALGGKPTSGPFARRDCVMLVVDHRRLVCIVADSDDERPRWTSTETTGRICGEPQLAGEVLLVADTSGSVTGIRLTDGGEAWRVELGAGRAPASSAASLGNGDMLVPLVDRTLLVAPLPSEEATDAAEPSASSEAAASAFRGAAHNALRTAAAVLLLAAPAAKAKSAAAADDEDEGESVASPDLRAVDDVRRRLSTAYPILDCAYAELPTSLLPQTARLPVERQVAALLFESPVRFDAEAEGGPGFVPGLGRGLPQVLAKGRLIDLPHAPPVKWSDYSPSTPHLVTAADLDWSVRLARRESSPGFSPAWASLVASAQPADERGPFAAAARLTRDYWQPLALIDFPVLPKHRFPQQGTEEEWAAFEKDPVGTGPYRLGHRTDDTLELLANNNYRRSGLPVIRQIMLHRFDPADAVPQFFEGKVQLVYGLPPQQVNEVRARGGRVEKLVSPSVCFLGVNYRHAALKDQDLRLAVANAIDRAKILDECFRPSNSAGDHQPLTGPFPRNCWAYNADVPAFDPASAKPLADEARRKLGRLPPLKLVVRTSEPGAAAACERIRQQCQAAGVDLALVPLAADQFFFQVTVQHDFDLVYWRHDFPDDSYWLGPLLDSDPRARSPGGANFMGYVPDSSVAEFERDLLLHKRFADIRSITHKLHAHLARTATLIPLWQLDTYVAVSDSLAGAKLTPLGLFDGIENWRRK